MPENSSHARMIIRHIATATEGSESIMELVRFSPADGGIVNAKGAARDNAEAITELIRYDFAYLWVIDRWDVEDSSGQAIVQPDLVVALTENGRQYHATM